MKSRPSLRVQLTLAFGVLVTTALAVAALASVRLIEFGLLGTLDALLVEEATTLAALVDIPGDRLATVIQDIGAETDIGPGKFAGVVAPDGRLTLGSRPFPPAALPRPAAVRDAVGVVTVGEDEAQFRIGWAPARSGGAVAVGVHASGAVRRAPSMVPQ